MQTLKRHAITGPQVWDGKAMSRRTDWVFELTDQMRVELDTATDHALQQGIHWQEINTQNFRIPVTAELLAGIADFLESGPGLAKLRGLDLTDLSEPARRIMFNGLGHNLGTPVSMSRQGMMMSDVTDEGARSAERYGVVRSKDDQDFLSSRARVHSTAQLRFHNDRADVVALLCVADAASGGESRLVSVPMIHNVMLKRHPDLLAHLFNDYDRSRLGEEFGDNANWYSIPIFGQQQGYFTAHYSRTFIEAAQLQPDVAKMTASQWQAIELMHEIADEFVFETSQMPGEIQLLNNHIVFHGRTAYQDHAEPERRRLLHRLWISMANSRPLPTSFAVLFREIEAGAVRGGIMPGQVETNDESSARTGS